MLELRRVGRAAIAEQRPRARSATSAVLRVYRVSTEAHCVGIVLAGVSMTSPFTTKTLAFLRALKRNNDRDWFRARKAEYEQHVRGPMVELLARLAARSSATFAPELVSDPRVSLYRIYRDTRFSNDKTPLKTHVAAHFPARGFPRGEGAGLYLEIAPQWVWIGGGLYMPSSSDLQAIRAHIAATHPQAASDRDGRGVHAGGRRARRRAAYARAARLPQGPSGGRLPAVQAVPRRPRVRGRVRDEPAFYPRAAEGLPRQSRRSSGSSIRRSQSRVSRTTPLLARRSAAAQSAANQPRRLRAAPESMW